MPHLPSQLWRRAGVVVAISLALHVAAVVTLMGSSLLHLLPDAPSVQIEVVSTPPTALPLGPAAAPAQPSAGAAPLATKKTKEQAKDKRAPKEAPDAGPDASIEDAGSPVDALPFTVASNTDGGLPAGLRADGPEGARLVVRLRLDRLRQAPQSRSFTLLADELLKLLPDRRRLIEGSGLDIFADFDTLVVATPNPLDDAVTFMAVHHHLTDEGLMNGLSRAAVANGRPIEWLKRRGRPIGLRPPGAMPSRDDRLFVLPELGWAVIAPGAYMQMLVPELVKTTTPVVDAGVAEDFSTLASRIRGEEEAMPEDVVLMASASQLLAARPGQAFTLPGSAPLTIPESVKVLIRLDPEPIVQLVLGFAQTQSADGWSKAVPQLCRQFAPHPMVLFTGMGAAIARVKVTQTPRDLPDTGADVLIEAPLTSAEAERILGFSTNMLRSRLRR